MVTRPGPLQLDLGRASFWCTWAWRHRRRRFGYTSGEVQVISVAEDGWNWDAGSGWRSEPSVLPWRAWCRLFQLPRRWRWGGRTHSVAEALEVIIRDVVSYRHWIVDDSTCCTKPEEIGPQIHSLEQWRPHYASQSLPFTRRTSGT